MNKQRLILFIPLVIFGVLVVLFNWGVDQDPSKLDTARLNQPVPAFNLKTLQDGRAVDQKQLKGPLLLNVWATWCPTCSAEHPYLVKLKQQGVTIVGLDYKDDRDAALKWLQDKGDPYAYVIADPQGSLGLDLGVYGAPETFVIDAQGLIRYRQIGEVNEEVWNKTIKPLLQGSNTGMKPTDTAEAGS